MTAEVAAADQLIAHEAIIERGLGSFLEVGAALIAIRDGKLYRATHSTFEAYCSDRWQIPRNHAYRLIDAAQAVAALSPIGDILPSTESQARELVGLPPEVAAEVMTAASESGKVTAATIREARDTIAPPVVKVTETTKTETFVDTATGEVVPPAEVEPSWKQNLRAMQEAKPRQRPITDAANDLGFELRKNADRLAALVGDKRYAQNEEQVALLLRGHLLHVAETVAAVLDQMP